MKIEHETIIQKALEHAAGRGLSERRMRALADELGVAATAIYWYAGNKAEPLKLMARDFYLDALEFAPGDHDWRKWLIGFGVALQKILLRHRVSARRCLTNRFDTLFISCLSGATVPANRFK